jgi:hypothetical protein
MLSVWEKLKFKVFFGGNQASHDTKLSRKAW